MRCYLIVDVAYIRDVDKYAEYVRRVPTVVAAFGGRYLTRGGKTEVLSGNWRPGRMVIVEFPSRDALQSWLNSEGYREMVHLREEAASANAVVIEGCGEALPC
ncbi:MAG: DUF1330 domain-containing protein [Candidatus Omnitrophota bacterium]|jgi:uncharacterized protein (DUF1330 family)